MIDLSEIIDTRSGYDYQRENFDSFLRKVGFSYSIPSIHITGTNGKGSTAHYIASIYEKAGLKVGLFESPHFYEINELISINGKNISDEDIKKYVNEELKFIKKFNLSPFEIETFVAFKYFQDQKCDVAVIECGMGGALDATNIFTPICSVITSISLEHTSFLGRSISEIAQHKVGIVKPYTPLVIGDFDEEATNVITRACRDIDAPIHSISIPNKVVLSDDGYSFEYQTLTDLHIQSSARYSVIDACYAIETINVLKDMFVVSIDSIKDGLNAVNMPGRLEIVSKSPFVIVDGAHNPEAMKRLVETINGLNSDKPIYTLFACFKDKNFASMLSIIGEISEEVVLTTFDNPRARTYEDYFLFAEDYKFEDDPLLAFKNLVNEHSDALLIVTGSLAFAGVMRKLIKEGK